MPALTKKMMRLLLLFSLTVLGTSRSAYGELVDLMSDPFGMGWLNEFENVLAPVSDCSANSSGTSLNAFLCRIAHILQIKGPGVYKGVVDEMTLVVRVSKNRSSADMYIEVWKELSASPVVYAKTHEVSTWYEGAKGKLLTYPGLNSQQPRRALFIEWDARDPDHGTFTAILQDNNPTGNPYSYSNIRQTVRVEGDGTSSFFKLRVSVLGRVGASGQYFSRLAMVRGAEVTALVGTATGIPTSVFPESSLAYNCVANTNSGTAEAPVYASIAKSAVTLLASTPCDFASSSFSYPLLGDTPSQVNSSLLEGFSGFTLDSYEAPPTLGGAQ